MTYQNNLSSLESMLEGFLQQVVSKKEDRLAVMEGMSSLDEIARRSSRGLDVIDEAGDWFATHNQWLTEPTLKTGDIIRIESILKELKSNLKISSTESPAEMKIISEVSRWDKTIKDKQPKLTLKRGPEHTMEAPDPDTDSISLFVKKLSRLTAIFMDHSGNKVHLLTILNDLIKSASLNLDKDALLLSGFIIYYLKQNGYKVQPYVKKLKEAEKSISKRKISVLRR